MKKLIITISLLVCLAIPMTKLKNLKANENELYYYDISLKDINVNWSGIYYFETKQYKMQVTHNTLTDMYYISKIDFIYDGDGEEWDGWYDVITDIQIDNKIYPKGYTLNYRLYPYSTNIVAWNFSLNDSQGNPIKHYAPVTMRLDHLYQTLSQSGLEFYESNIQFTYNTSIDYAYNTGYQNGYNQAKDEYEDLNDFNSFQNGKQVGIEEGINIGKNQGYNEGYTDGVADSTTGTGNFTYLIGTIFSSFGIILGVELFPGLTIGMLVLIPLVFGLIFFILGKKGD